MKKKTNSLLIIIILLIILIASLSNSFIVINTVVESFNMFINKIFPTLFTFFIISDLLINFGFSELIGELFKNIFTRVFNIKKEACHVLIISMISGFPGSAKYIKDLLDNNTINESDATKLLTFTHFSNPLFIIGTIGIIFLNNKTLGLLILISHYISAFIVGILFKNLYKNELTSEKVSIKTGLINMHKKRINNSSFIKILSNSIYNSINTLILIFGIITIFSLISNIFINYLPINNCLKVLLTGSLEFTNGLKLLSITNLSIIYKALLSVAFISFGGFCVHLQVFSILSNYKLNYLTYFCSRLIHVLLAVSLLFILITLLY